MIHFYSRWLGIPANLCPPTYYQLLDVNPSELNPVQIQAAAEVQLQRLMEHREGPEAEQCQRLIDEVMKARDTLIDPISKRRYDQLIPHPGESWWNPENTVQTGHCSTEADPWWKQPKDEAIEISAVVAPQPEKSIPGKLDSPIVSNHPQGIWWENTIPEQEQLKVPLPPVPRLGSGSVDSQVGSEPGIQTDDLAQPSAPNFIPPPLPQSQVPTSKRSEPNLPESASTFEVELVPISVEEVPTSKRSVPNLPESASTFEVELVPISVEEVPPFVEAQFETEEVEPILSPRRRPSPNAIPLALISALLVLGGVAIGVYFLFMKPRDGANSQPQAASGPTNFRQISKNEPAISTSTLGEGDKKSTSPSPDDRKKVKERGPEVNPKPKLTNPETLPKPRLIAIEPPADADPKKVVEEPKKNEFAEPATYRGHKASVVGMAITQDAKTALTVSTDRTVLIHSIAQQTQRVLSKLKEEGVAVSVRGDGKLAVFCDGGEITVFDLVEKQAKKSFFNARGGIECLGIDPGSGLILTGSTDGTIRFWTGESDTPETTLDLANHGIATLAIAAEGGVAAVGFVNGMVCTIDLKKRKEIKRWLAGSKRITALAVSPDGKSCASVSEDRVARSWASDTGKALQKFTGHEGLILGMQWTSEGKRLVTAGLDKQILVWDAHSGNRLERLGQTEEKIYCLAIDAQDRFVLAGQSDGTIQRMPIRPLGEPKQDTPKTDEN